MRARGYAGGVRCALVGALAAALLIIASLPQTLAAQRTHVLLVTGLSGEPRFAEAFEGAARAVYDAARTQWKIGDSSLVWLAEDPARDRTRIRGRATREAVAEAFIAMSRQVSAGDVLAVVLIGHGGGEGAQSRVNLPGPDPTAADYATWLAGFAKQTVVFVNASSASGDFVDVLRGPQRVVVTATRSALERNESVFAGHFARGLATGAADADKDGRVSMLEAFGFAMREVERHYETAGTLRSERAVLSDSALAARVSLGPPAAGSDNPQVRALLAERQALEAQVASLRARKEQMTVEAYETELERLVLLIAEKTAELRAAGGRP